MLPRLPPPPRIRRVTAAALALHLLLTLLTHLLPVTTALLTELLPVAAPFLPHSATVLTEVAANIAAVLPLLLPEVPADIASVATYRAATIPAAAVIIARVIARQSTSGSSHRSRRSQCLAATRNRSDTSPVRSTHRDRSNIAGRHRP